MTPEQYREALTAALMAFDANPTQANLELVYAAANAFQTHVEILDDQVAQELRDLQQYVRPQTLPASVTTASMPKWAWWAIAAGVAFFLFKGK